MIDSKGFPSLNSEFVIAFDPSGMVFALGFARRMISLYDIKQFDRGPFLSIDLMNSEYGSELLLNSWISMEFSNDGTFLILNNGYKMYLIDTLKSEAPFIIHKYQFTQSDIKISSKLANFTPQDNFLYTGNSSGYPTFWNKESEELVVQNQASKSLSPIDYMLFNPKYSMFATCHEDFKLYFWISNL